MRRRLSISVREVHPSHCPLSDFRVRAAFARNAQRCVKHGQGSSRSETNLETSLPSKRRGRYVSSGTRNGLRQSGKCSLDRRRASRGRRRCSEFHEGSGAWEATKWFDHVTQWRSTAMFSEDEDQRMFVADDQGVVFGLNPNPRDRDTGFQRSALRSRTVSNGAMTSRMRPCKSDPSSPTGSSSSGRRRADFVPGRPAVRNKKIRVNL